MSWSERSVRDQRRRTDYAIHHAFAQLASDPTVLETFQEMLHCVRKRAPRLFEAPIMDGRHCGVDALVHLSRFRGDHIRQVTDWVDTTSSWRSAAFSLAHHLTAKYEVPRFLASAWYATDSAADNKRRWWVEHSRGASFRSLNLPLLMTRKMEHLFLTSWDHLPIEYALRKAELLGLGASKELLAAVLSTRLATDLRHGEFWRTVWMFLIENKADLELSQIGPIIDYIQAVRHERIAAETAEGIVDFGACQPAFSVKGRTIKSLMRLVQAWHRSLGTGGPGFSWTHSPFQPLMVAEPGRDRAEPLRRWQMFELTNSAQLRSEGAALHHCVASYAEQCYRGVSSIWSLRLWQGETVKHVLTVEVDPKKRAVVQARGRANRAASGRSLQLLQDWAERERLQVAL